MNAGGTTGHRARRGREAASVALVLLAATVIRVFNLANEAVWHDEIATLEFLDNPTLTGFLDQTNAVTPVPPVYSITQFYWSRVFGNSVPALRYLSLVYGLAGIAALYGLGRSLFGHRAGLLAAAWMSLTHWHVFHSQEIRFYGMVALLAILAVWSFVRFVTRPSAAGLAVHSAASAAMAWTHPHSVLLFPALGIFLLAFRWRRRGLVAAWMLPHLAIAGSLAAFMVAIDRDVAYAQTGWLPYPTLWRGYPSVHGVLAMASGQMEFAHVNTTAAARLPWRRGLWALVEVLTLGGSAAGVVLMYRQGAREPGTSRLTSRELAALLALWFVVPLFLAYAGSSLWRPIFLGRYLVFAFVPLYLLMGWWRRYRGTAVAAMLIAPLVLFDALYYFPVPSRARYDRVASAIQDDSAGTTAIFVDDMLAAGPLRYYSPNELPEILGPLEMEKAVDLWTGAVTLEADTNWMLLNSEKRVRFLRQDLKRAGVPFDERYFPSLAPLWLFRVSGPQSPRASGTAPPPN